MNFYPDTAMGPLHGHRPSDKQLTYLRDLVRKVAAAP
jgi:hypothetical protein